MIRIFRHTTFGSRAFGPEFDKIFVVSWTHALSEAASFSAEIAMPVGGLLTGPRFATLVIDGKVIATGEMSGYPMGRPGQTISVEFICRHPDHSLRVDAIYNAIPVSARLVDSAAARRSEPYVPADIYHPPITGLPELVRIGGVTKSGFEILGEGFDDPEHPILDNGLDLGMPDSPLSRLKLVVTSTHTQVDRRVLDFGTAIGPRETLTPEEYKAAITSLSITGSNMEQLSSTVEEQIGGFSHPAQLVTVRRPRIDPITHLKFGRKDVLLEGAAFNAPSIPTVVMVEQPRREDLTFTVSANILPNFGGARAETENIGLANPEESITNEVSFWRSGRGENHPGYIRRYQNVGASFFKGADEAKLVMKNLTDYAAAKLLRAAHCVRVDVIVPASTAQLLTPKDRITVRCATLDGGYVTGQVVGVEWTEGEGAGEGRIELRVPCGQGGEYATPQDVSVNGTITTTNTLTALASLNEDYFVDDVEFSGDWPEQVEAIDKINEKNQVAKPTNEVLYESDTIVSVREYLPKPEVSIGFRQLGGAENIVSPLTATFAVNVQKGIGS